MPGRPNTPPEAALDAMERLVQMLLVDVARLKGGADDLVGKREGLLQAFAANPIDGPRREVVDHMDWLLSLAETTLRQRGG